MERSILYNERRKIMGNEKMLEKDNKNMSWEKFKNRYLSKVEYLAKMLELDRDKLIKKVKESHYERELKCKDIDDDYRFVEGVIDSIIDIEGDWGEKPLIYKVKNTNGAEDIFDEVYRIWINRVPLDNKLYFEKAPRYRGIRSEVGKGDIVDIYTAYRESDETHMSFNIGEDFADSLDPIVVKVKKKKCMRNDELAKALRDLADAIDEKFINCLYSPSTQRLHLGDHKEYQAIRCGLYNSDRKLWYRVATTPYKVHTSIKDAGWIDQNISLKNGLGVMLQKGWPDLYERVLDRELSPFEALLETGHVHPKDMYEVCGNGLDTGELLKSKWPNIYESVIGGKISHFEALMKTDLINWKHVEEFSDNSDDRGDIEKVLKNGEPELYEKVLQNEISVFRALLEADLIDSVALYRTIIYNEEIEDVYEFQVEQVDESDEQLLQVLEGL